MSVLRERLVERFGQIIDSRDSEALRSVARECAEAYGWVLVRGVLVELLDESSWLFSQVMAAMEPKKREDVELSLLDNLTVVLKAHGLRVEDNFRATASAIAFSIQAIEVFRNFGFEEVEKLGEGNENLEGFGIDRNPYIHELAGSGEFDGLNSWGTISVIISTAMGWCEHDPGADTEAVDIVAQCVSRLAPNVNVRLLMNRARYCDNSLTRLAELCEQGFSFVVAQTED